MAEQWPKMAKNGWKWQKIAKNGGNTEGFSISSVYGGILRKTEAVATLPGNRHTLLRSGQQGSQGQGLCACEDEERR